MEAMHAHLDGPAAAVPNQGGSPSRTTIRAEATLAWLRTLRAEVRSWLAGHDIAPATSTDVVLGLSEAAANVVEHGYRGSSGPIAVTLEVHDDRIEVTVADGGRWQTGPSAPDRGRGLEIIRRLSTTPPTIATTETGTTVTFWVDRTPAP